VSKVKEIVSGKEWATNKANDVYNAPQECLHYRSSPPLIPNSPHSHGMDLLSLWNLGFFADL
jgi:hypothetical protein